jgi:GNAT superfamily N-acetyltransferase
MPWIRPDCRDRDPMDTSMRDHDREIRLAGSDDYPAIVALYRELVGEIPVAEGEAGRAHWRALLSHSSTSVLAAETDRRIVAMATLHILPNMTYGGRPYALIENVVTAKDHQGQGFGRQVMQAAIARAWDAGAHKIMLLTGKKRGARPFYEKLGFDPDEKFGMTLRRPL